MKKIVLLSMLSGLLWTGCTKQEAMMSSQSESSFLTVKIVSAGTVGTRTADEEYEQPEKPENGEKEGLYKDGTDKENEIASVLFLFFDKDGKPANATKTADGKNYLSYILLEDISQEGPYDQDHSETVEKILERTLTITVPHKTARPAQVLVVVNPPKASIASLTTKTLGELRETVEDFETRLTNKSGEEKFVMTNSVYVDGDSVCDTTPLTDENYRPTMAPESESKPVIVYVERILARIDLSIGIPEEDRRTLSSADGEEYYIYHTGSSIPEGLQKEGSDNNLYVRFLGWNVFDTPNRSRLVKSVDKKWQDKDLFGYDGMLPWNAAIFHRSFWAVNPPENQFEYKHGSFTNGGDAKDEDFDGKHNWTADHNEMPVGEKYVTAYFQENAAPNEDPNAAPTTPSKVIIAAQLVNSEGTPYELAKWAGNTYTVDGLKTLFANTLNIWSGETTGTEATGTTTVYKKIKPEDLTFTSEEGKYTVSVTLSDAAKEKKWYSRNGDVFTPIENVQTNIDTALQTESVMVWKNGYTYFYFTIQHLGAKEYPGYQGVVRNHIYEASVRSVSGIGTPVYNEEDDIIHTTEPNPEDDKSILSAEVRILSWRVVRQDYHLNW